MDPDDELGEPEDNQLPDVPDEAPSVATDTVEDDPTADHEPVVEP